MPALSINLNPHKTNESVSIGSDTRRRKKFNPFTLDSVPAHVSGFIRIDTNASVDDTSPSMVDVVLRNIEASRPGSTSERYRKLRTGRRIAANNIGCILTPSKEPHFLKPPGRCRLPLGYRWILDPETQNPFNRTRTVCGDIVFLNLNGDQVAIVQDCRMRRWAISYGFWIVMSPCLVLSFTPSIRQLTQDFNKEKSHQLPLFTAGQEEIGQLLLLGPNQEALVQYRNSIIELTEARHVILDERSILRGFLALGISQTPCKRIRCSSHNEKSSCFDAVISWRCFEPTVFLKNCSSLRGNRTVRIAFASLLRQAYVSSKHSKRSKESLEDLQYTVSVQLSRALISFGLEMISLTLTRSQKQ